MILAEGLVRLCEELAVDPADVVMVRTRVVGAGVGVTPWRGRGCYASDLKRGRRGGGRGWDWRLFPFSMAVWYRFVFLR